MAIGEDYSPIFQGDTGAPFAPQFLHRDGTAQNLTGATISMKMQLVSQSGAIGDPGGTIKTGSGTWTIDDALNGKTHYQYASTDVDTPGVWNLYITVTISGHPVHGDDGNFHVKQLTILPAP